MWTTAFSIDFDMELSDYHAIIHCLETQMYQQFPVMTVGAEKIYIYSIHACTTVTFEVFSTKFDLTFKCF